MGRRGCVSFSSVPTPFLASWPSTLQSHSFHPLPLVLPTGCHTAGQLLSPVGSHSIRTASTFQRREVMQLTPSSAGCGEAAIWMSLFLQGAGRMGVWGLEAGSCWRLVQKRGQGEGPETGLPFKEMVQAGTVGSQAHRRCVGTSQQRKQVRLAGCGTAQATIGPGLN